VENIVKKNLLTEPQLTAAFEYFLSNLQENIDVKAFNDFCGVGVVVTLEQIKTSVAEVINKNKDENIDVDNNDDNIDINLPQNTGDTNIGDNINGDDNININGNHNNITNSSISVCHLRKDGLVVGQFERVKIN